jgi:hypothetical protein
VKVYHIIADMDRNGGRTFRNAKAERLVEGQHGVRIRHWECHMIKTTDTPRLLCRWCGDPRRAKCRAGRSDTPNKSPPGRFA